MKVLITGIAGFIGYHTAFRLLHEGYSVIGIDNLNDYYDVELKKDRLNQLELLEKDLTFYHNDITSQSFMDQFLQDHGDSITHIIHLAAQPGVRYSLENPRAYIQSNIVGHLEILELCRHTPNLTHCIYASSSSVYGGNTTLPFATTQPINKPVSLYAATKAADELMSYTYSHLYHIPLTGMRFFTVYGPWGRPDMAPYIFTSNILQDKPITLFNHGNMQRDFTYIDDVVECLATALHKPPQSEVPHAVYNVGNNKPEELTEFVSIIEACLDKKAIIRYDDIQPGDIQATYADIKDTTEHLDFIPSTPLAEGLPHFVKWLKNRVN